MKKVTLAILVTFIFVQVFSQVKIGDNPTTVNSHSLLELESHNKGMLLPRLNKSEIGLMINPPTGMLVFNTTDSALAIKRDTGWAALSIYKLIKNEDVAAGAGISYSKLSLSNSIANGDLTANAITTSKVANGTVTTSKMADSAINSLKLLGYAVKTAHISDGAVTGNKLSDGTITSSKMADSVISGLKLASNSVNTAHIIDGAVTGNKILDGTITGADISSSAAIPYSKLSLTNSISNGDLTANAITTSKVANGTVTTSKMADSAISSLKLLGNAVRTAHILDGAVTGNKIQDGALTTSKFVDSAISGQKLASNSVNSVHIVAGAVTNSEIADNAAIPYSKLSLTSSIINSDLTINCITTSRVANGTVTTFKMADSAISGLKILSNAVSTVHIADGAVTASKLNTSGASVNQVLSFNGTQAVWGSPAFTTAAYAELSIPVVLTNIPGTVIYNPGYIVKIIKIGNKVTFTFPQDLTNLSIANGGVDIKVIGIPAAYLPATSQYFPVFVKNGGVEIMGLAYARNLDILIKPSASGSGGNWNGVANCGFYAFSISYAAN